MIRPALLLLLALVVPACSPPGPRPGPLDARPGYEEGWDADEAARIEAERQLEDDEG